MEIKVDYSSTASWQSLVRDALGKSNQRLTEDLESYLIGMLIRFTSNIELVNSVLALDYLTSQNIHGHLQHEKLRDLGDKCLLYAGFYPEQAHKRLVSFEYFVNMGRGAYEQIAVADTRLSTFDGLNELFSELSQNFVNLTDLLHQIKLMDETQQWMLDEITKYEKSKLQTKAKGIITVNKLDLH